MIYLVRQPGSHASIFVRTDKRTNKQYGISNYMLVFKKLNYCRPMILGGMVFDEESHQVIYF